MSDLLSLEEALKIVRETIGTLRVHDERKQAERCKSLFAFLESVGRTAAPVKCMFCNELTPCRDCLGSTGGRCAEHQEAECTCYEMTGGHMPGCVFNRSPTVSR